MDAYAKLISGYKDFKKDYLSEENKSWLDFHSTGQAPKVMVIACSDSRVDPVTLTKVGLGDIFMVRSVANIVPTFNENGGGDSTCAALEYAVNHLKVEHIVVMGHSGCGGIAAMMNGDIDEKTPFFQFIKPWVNNVIGASKDGGDACDCEKKGVLLSLDNLKGYPWIAERIENGDLNLHGWYFDIGSGNLSEYSEGNGSFEEID